MRLVLLLAGLALLSASCKSADELYNEGQALELRGDYEAAAYHYAESLTEQPGLRKARGRLIEAGKIAVERQLRYIAEYEAAGEWIGAANTHRRLDGLVAMAQGVGVALALPAGYAEQRRANFDAAVAVFLDEGAAAVARGEFWRAIQGYSSARQYESSPQREEALTLATTDAYVALSDAEAAKGNFRAAHHFAGQALDLVPPGSAAAAQIIRRQTEALDRGSLRTAFAPVQPTRRARDLPRGFVGALNDELELDHWTQPPPFVLALEQALVRRALRDLSLEREPLSPRDLADLGRTLGVDAVFAAEVNRFERTVTEKDREEKSARTRGGERIAYTRIEDEVLLSATVAFDVVEAGTGRVLCEREVERSVRDRIARGEYGGSLRTLALSGSERRLFDADARAEAERDLEDDLVRVLAERLAETAFGCLLREVP